MYFDLNKFLKQANKTQAIIIKGKINMNEKNIKSDIELSKKRIEEYSRMLKNSKNMCVIECMCVSDLLEIEKKRYTLLKTYLIISKMCNKH